jgi:hypothetical protein
MLLGLVFGFVFAAIGVSVIFHLWTASGFGAPPLFFKVFGTLVAIPFLAVGGTLFTAALRGQSPTSRGPGSSPSPPHPGTGYTCPGCGNRLGEEADVSPKGDVKCGYCRRWFNIHSA